MDKVQSWLEHKGYGDFSLSVASADASFRKYYRVHHKKNSYIVMDASLEKESLHPFIDIMKRLADVDVTVAQIYEQDVVSGYLLLEDFGNTNLLDILDEHNFERYYLEAIEEIVKMQQANIKGLPLYDKAFLHFEMDLMGEWYLSKYLSVKLQEDELKLIDDTLHAISEVVLSQPQGVFVHRDFHSRNIMVMTDDKLGIIDYQDAMNGAITYDLVSLLKDCYISFARDKIEALALHFRDKVVPNVSDGEFLKWFDFMGLQRHIKVLGIFARLHLRDGKDGYLKDIPLTLRYVVETALRYEQTQQLGVFLQKVGR